MYETIKQEKRGNILSARHVGVLQTLERAWFAIDTHTLKVLVQ